MENATHTTTTNQIRYSIARAVYYSSWDEGRLKFSCCTTVCYSAHFRMPRHERFDKALEFFVSFSLTMTRD